MMPALVTSTDDSTLFICEGEQPTGNVEWRLANPDDVDQRGTHSLYDTDGNNGHLNGLRVKLTHIVNATGQSAPVFISVLGLSANELPNDEMFLMKIPGLSPGGSIFVENEVVGNILFQRKSATGKMDSRRFLYYREHGLIPFVERLRECLDG